MAKRREVKPVYTDKVQEIMLRGMRGRDRAAATRDQLVSEAGLTPEVAAALGRELRASKGLVAPSKQVGYKKPTRKER
jgi:hypothetical protein